LIQVLVSGQQGILHCIFRVVRVTYVAIGPSIKGGEILRDNVLKFA